MTNNAPGNCGNDLALDDITFRPCGPNVVVLLTGISGDSVNVCQGQSDAYTINSSLSAGYSTPAYQWQVSTDNLLVWTDIANANGASYTRPQTGTGDYDYRVAVAEAANINNPSCRVNSQVVSIDVNPLPQLKVPHNYNLCTSDTLVLAVSGCQTCNWTGPNNFTGSDSTITIVNPAISYSGKYFITASSAEGCFNTDSLNVVVYPAAIAGVNNDTAVCEGATVQLSGTGGVNYNWSPATGLSSAVIPNPVATPADTTTYMLTVTDANGCMAKDSVTIDIWKSPAANAGPNKTIFQGQEVQLNATVAGTGVYYTWQPDYNINNNTLLQPDVYPAQDTTYTLFVTSRYGCGVAQSSVFVRVFEKVLVPNAFSPNGDGINDTWRIEKLDTYPEADLYVFSRNGQPVLHSKGNGKPWDGTFNGKKLPLGTYYYVIDLKNGLPKMSGWVEILY